MCEEMLDALLSRLALAQSPGTRSTPAVPSPEGAK